MERRVAILAAGQGKRMNSARPKVLHRVGGIPLLEHVVREAEALGLGAPVVVVGSGDELIRELFGERIILVRQDPPRGTGDAVRQAEALLAAEGPVLVLYGDTPLLQAELLASLLERHREGEAAVTVLTAEVPDPTGYGRIRRDEAGNLRGIVEERDATDEERRGREVNTGIYVFSAPYLRRALPQLDTRNAQGEYYLTDAVALILAAGGRGQTLAAPDYRLVLGVNDREDLAVAESIWRERRLRELWRDGVTVEDPASTFVGAAVRIGRDTVLRPFTILEGRTEVGEGCLLGPWSHIRDSRLGDRVKVEASTVEEADLAVETTVGPYSHLRPGVRTEPGVKIGNYAELKNVTLGAGAKVPHHSYLGDASIGSRVNVGAGTVIVNYDGREKHHSEIGDGVFIGCNANLVSPVRIGSEAFVAAGSTVTKDIPAEALAVSRAEQRNIEGWVRRRRWKKSK